MSIAHISHATTAANQSCRPDPPAWATIGQGNGDLSISTRVVAINSGNLESGTQTSVIMGSLSGYVLMMDQRASFLIFHSSLFSSGSVAIVM